MSRKVTTAGWGAMANDLTGEAAPGAARTKRYHVRPSRVQAAYLSRGLNQPGGKLPLFDRRGQRYKPHTVQSCIEQGWAEPWFDNPMKPDWLICKLTEDEPKSQAPPVCASAQRCQNRKQRSTTNQASWGNALLGSSKTGPVFPAQ